MSPEEKLPALSNLGLPVSLEMFETGLQQRAAFLTRVQTWLRGLLIEGVDYGREEGIDKPFIHKPGLEKLAGACGATYRINELKETELPNGHLEVVAHLAFACNEKIMGEGVGSCSTMESRYRFRKADRVCPSCGKPAIIKGKAEYGGGWLCFAKRGGCGKKFGDQDPAITEQPVGRVEHDNPADYRNTARKMAIIRAMRDTCHRALGVSGIFAQPREEYDGVEDTAQKSEPNGWDRKTQNVPPDVAARDPRLREKPDPGPLADRMTKKSKADESPTKTLVADTYLEVLQDYTNILTQLCQRLGISDKDDKKKLAAEINKSVIGKAQPLTTPELEKCLEALRERYQKEMLPVEAVEGGSR